MVKLQMDLSEEENKKLNIYKSIYSIKRKEAAIKKIILDLDLEELLHKNLKKER